MTYNFLFISVDDLCSIDDQVSLLIPGYDLPNLRRLKDKGTDFRRSYCPVPICGPSRASTMSNLSPAETGVLNNAYNWWDCGLRPEHMMNYRFKRAGYFMGSAGKVFHGYGPQQPWIHSVIYDTPRLPVDSWLPPRDTRRDMGGRLGWAYTGDETKFYDHVMASRFVKFVEDYDGSRPWFYEVGFYKPHTDYDAPLRIYESLDWRRVVMPEAWKAGWNAPQFVQENLVQGLFSDLSTHPDQWTEEMHERWQKSVRNYAASALWMDEQLGRLLDALDASDYADNTIVSLYSDHGYHLGDQGHWHKFTLYEAAARTPHVVYVPGLAPQEVWSPVSHLDLYATLMDFAGIPRSSSQRGVSQRSWIEAGKGDTQRPVPTFWFGSCSVGYKDFRATIYSDGSFELFDAINDPWLTTNLAATHTDADQVRSVLLDTMRDWGWSVVEEGEAVRTGTIARTFLGGASQANLTARHNVMFGNVDPTGRSPYYQQVWRGSTDRGGKDHVHDWTVPAGMEEMAVTEWTHLDRVTIKGGYTGNRIVMDDWTWGTKTFLLGHGDNELAGTNLPRGTVRIHSGSGNDILRSNANWWSDVYLGDGNDRLMVTGSGGHRVMAVSGTNVIETNAGDDEIHTGHGNNVIRTGKGNDRILIEGGKNDIDPGPGKNVVQIGRTGLPQIIRNMDAGDTRIDLSDFGGLPLRWVSEKDDRHRMTTGDESVLFIGLGLNDLKNRIIGL